MQEMFQSKEFRRYRKAVLEEAVAYLSGMVWDGNPELKGALEMLRRIIKLPIKLTGNELLASNLIQEDIKDFQMRFIKNHIAEEDG